MSLMLGRCAASQIASAALKLACCFDEDTHEGRIQSWWPTVVSYSANYHARRFG